MQSALAVDDIDGLERGGGLGWRDRVRVDVEGRRLAQIADHCRAACDVAAVDAECLSERADEQIGSLRASHFLRAPARITECADAVRVIDDQDDILGKSRIVPIDDFADGSERRMIAAHAEDAVGHHDRPLARRGGLGELALEVGQIEMPPDALLGGPSK